MTVDRTFDWEYHHHHLQVTTHRKLMQPGGGGGGGGPGEATGAVDGGAAGGAGGGGPEEATPTTTTAAAAGPASDLVLAATGPEFAPSEFYESYEIMDDDTSASMTVDVNATHRNIVSNTIPLFDIGNTTFPESDPFLISEQVLTASLPLTPTYTGLASEAAIFGVSVLGQKFEPGTAEIVTCDNGVSLSFEV